MRVCRIFFVAMLVLLLMALSHALAEENHSGTSVFNLPASLRVIKESAFENTSPTKVRLNDRVEYIGDRAFAGKSKIDVIFIPKDTGFIGEDAFAGRDGLVIAGIHGSYAEDWARRHGYRFVHFDIWIHRKTERGRYERRLVREPVHEQSQSDDNESARKHFGTSFEIGYTNPKEKPEMYPVDYDFP